LPEPSTKSLIHFTRTGRLYSASIVSDGALWTSRPRPLIDLTAPYPHTVVAGNGPGRICCENCWTEIS
jgi:hypothetical protein